MAKDPSELKRLHSTAADVPPPAVHDSAPVDELMGTTYLGKYELVDVLGVGGMGVIYSGRQIFLDRMVAIKMLKNNLASVKQRTRFHQEAKAASALKHPGIVAILDFGVDDLDRPYMVMEHVEGCTISDLLDERLTLPIEDILPVFLEICDALSEAHKKGIVHRDLKPSNIMLVIDDQGDPHIKILDFGIAKLLDFEDRTFQDLTKTGDALGTPLYMSPEQVRGKDVTYKSDLYSLGCMLYACLTGTPPFVGENKMTTMDMHLTERPASLRVASDGLDFPDGVEGIVMRLLEKKPESRFESAEELKKALLEMAARNGFLPDSGNNQRIAGGGQSQKVQTADPLQQTSKTARSVRPGRGKSDTESVEFQKRVERNANTVYWNSDLSARVKSARPDKPRSLPRRTDSFVVEEESQSSVADASLNKTFVIAAGIVASVLVIGGVAAILYWKPGPTYKVVPATNLIHFVKNEVHSPEDKSGRMTDLSEVKAANPRSNMPDLGRSADDFIKDKIAAGAVDSTLSLKASEGLTKSGLQLLSRFKLLRTLNLGSTDLKDDEVGFLVDLPIKTLCLDDNRELSDKSLPYLARMKGLQYLSLAYTDISDSGMKALAASPTLLSLWLSYDRSITDQGIKNLSPDTSPLRSLFFTQCAITDAAAEDLIKFRYMFSLDLADNPKISDRTLEALQRKPNGLECLVIANDNIGDAGIHALTRIKYLRTLDISGIKLSLAAQKDLATMTGLTHLYVVGCQLTPYEIGKLSKALPSTTVESTARVKSYLL